MNGGYGGCARTAPSEGRRHDHQATNPENVRDYIRSLEDLLSGRLPKTPSSAKRIARRERVTLADRGAPLDAIGAPATPRGPINLVKSRRRR